MVGSMKVNGMSKQINLMVEEFKFGLMDPAMKASGRMVSNVDTEDQFMRKETFILESGKMIKHMAMVFTSTIMVTDTKVNGSQTNSMEKVLKDGPMVPCIQVNMLMAKSKEKVNSCGLIRAAIKVNFSRMIFKVKESTIGLMEDPTMASGLPVKWKEEVFSCGQMDENMLATIRMTLSTAMVH